MAYSEKDEAHYQSWLAKQSAMGRPVPVGGPQYPTAVTRPSYAPFAPADPETCTCVDPFADCPTHG